LIPLTNKLQEESITKLLVTLSSYFTNETKHQYKETCLLGMKSIISVVRNDYQELVGNMLFQEILKGFKTVRKKNNSIFFLL
jgi:hypothetical protein